MIRLVIVVAALAVAGSLYPSAGNAASNIQAVQLMGQPVKSVINTFESKGVTGTFIRDDVWTEDVELMYLAPVNHTPDGEASLYLMATPAGRVNLFAIHWTTPSEDFRFSKYNKVGNNLIGRVFGPSLLADFISSSKYTRKVYRSHSRTYYKGRLLAYATSRSQDDNVQTFSAMPIGNLNRNIEIEESHQ